MVNRDNIEMASKRTQSFNEKLELLAEESSLQKIQDAMSETENTYRVTPEVPFSTSKVRKLVNEILKERLQHVTYEPRRAKELCMSLSDELKMRVKQLGFNRHKLVCHVLITSGSKKSLSVASRFLWDPSADSYVTVSYEGLDSVTIVTLYGVFLE